MSDQNNAHYAKYEKSESGNQTVILKDGHTMFSEDVVRDLNRKSYLEAENERLRAVINKASAALWSWIYSRKSRRITDIHDDLKALVNNGGCDG